MNLLNQINRHIKINGVRGTIHHGFRRIASLLRAPTPDPWLSFDQAHGVQTCGQMLADDVKGANWLNGQRYQGCDPIRLTDALSALDLPPSCQFVDLGSGKGRALIAACAFPFARIVGVEYSAALHEAARQNIGDRPRIDLVCQDAALYPLPQTPLVIFMFNPFGAEVMRQVIEKVKRHPYQVHIIYQGTLCRDLLLSYFVAVQDDGWMMTVTAPI